MDKPPAIVGTDESKHNFHALEWTLNHVFTSYPSNPPFNLVIVNAKPSPSSTFGLVGPGAVEIFPIVDSDLQKVATRIVEKAKEICATKSHSSSRAVLGSVSKYLSSSK